MFRFFRSSFVTGPFIFVPMTFQSLLKIVILFCLVLTENPSCLLTSLVVVRTIALYTKFPFFGDFLVLSTACFLFFFPFCDKNFLLFTSFIVTRISSFCVTLLVFIHLKKPIQSAFLAPELSAIVSFVSRFITDIIICRFFELAAKFC